MWIEHIVHVLVQVAQRLACVDAGPILADCDPHSVMSDRMVIDFGRKRRVSLLSVQALDIRRGVRAESRRTTRNTYSATETRGAFQGGNGPRARRVPHDAIEAGAGRPIVLMAPDSIGVGQGAVIMARTIADRSLAVFVGDTYGVGKRPIVEEALSHPIKVALHAVRDKLSEPCVTETEILHCYCALGHGRAARLLAALDVCQAMVSHGAAFVGPTPNELAPQYWIFMVEERL